MLIRIYGNPKPQGSKNAWIRGGRVVLTEASKDLPAWRETCIMAFRAAVLHSEQKQFLGPVQVTLTFYMQKAKSSNRKYPNMAPDLDKLCRSVGDSLEISELISNDAQIVSLTAHKVFADTPEDAGVEVVITSKP